MNVNRKKEKKQGHTMAKGSYLGSYFLGVCPCGKALLSAIKLPFRVEGSYFFIKLVLDYIIYMYYIYRGGFW